MMKKYLRIVFVVIILLEIAGAFSWLPLAKDFTWIGLLVTIGFAWAMLEIFNFSPLIWFLALLMVILDSISSMEGLYSLIDPWDRLVHLCGGFLVAMAALELILRILKKEHVRVERAELFIGVNVFFAVVSVGFLYEFWEYLVDRVQYGYPKSLVNAYDSIEDQLFNILGGALVLISYFVWRKRKKMLGDK